MNAGRHCTNPPCARPLKPHEWRCHGWCPACYRRWNDGGRPADGPPPPRKAGREYMAAAKAARVEQAARLAAQGLAPRAVAMRMGLTETTIREYLKALAPEGAAMASDSLKIGAEIHYSGGAHADTTPAAEPDVGHRSGRELEKWEQEIITGAVKAARVRDAAMLNGVPWRAAA